MRIALISENSQADKNSIVWQALSKSAKKYGHEVVNYGMFSASDSHELTYVKAGLLSGILLNFGAVDFVVTGCGTGEGAMMALNAFPNVFCAHVVDAGDAYMFRQINDGNAISLPLAKGFGWGAELAIEDIFDKLLCCKGGEGYPKERADSERTNRLCLSKIKSVTTKDMLTILNEIDQDFLKQTIDYDVFKNDFFAHCKNKNAENLLKKVIKM